MGASLVWSCTGEVGPSDSNDSPKAGANGATGNGGSGGAAKPASGTAGQSVSGGAGRPATGAAGQSGAGSATPAPTGQAGTGTVAPPTTGQAGTGSVVPPATGGTGQAGTGSVVPPATGAAGQAGTGTVPPPPTGQAGTGSVVPPATGAAGQGGTGSVAPPPTGAAGSGATPGTTGKGGAAPSTGGTTGTTTPPTTSTAATIVPLYTDPSDSSWNAVISGKMEHPTVGVVAIVNPSDGPGSAASSAYKSGISRLTAAGIKVIGYVATGYASKTAATVEADIDRWKNFYPGQLGGIFFDEQSNRAADVAFYRELSQYAKAQGLMFTVGNPGTDTAEGYVGALDTMLIYESDGLPSTSQMGGWHSKYAPSNFGIIPYAVSMDATFVHTARQYVQYIYLQSDNLPNPWDSLPSYFSSLLAALE